MDIRDAEVFEAGTWTGESGGTNSFTVEDLDAIVSSFAMLNLSGRVPIKLGHNKKQPLADGQPALGWVAKLRREGRKLLADLTDIPRVVYDAIKAGRFKFVSVELLKGVQAGTRKIPWVLDAVALLGADQPAVGTLQDLQSLTMARGCGLQAAARITFSRGATQVSDEVAELREQIAAQNKQLIDLTFENAIRAGQCLPAAKVQFARRFRDTGTLDDAAEWIRTAPKPASRGPHTLSTSAADVARETDEPADVRMGAAATAVIAERFKETGERLDLVEATKVAMRRDPKLAREYINLHGVTE